MTALARALERPGLGVAIQRAYPEAAFGGFSRVDGTVAFCSRVHALLLDAGAGLVVDVGCGRATRVADPARYRRDLQDLRAPGRTVVGIDIDPEAATNPYVDEFRLIPRDGAWPVESGRAGLVYCDYVLEHVAEPDAFFDEIARVLRPGGYACIRTPNRAGYVAVAARLIPERRHLGLLAVANRGSVRSEARDVFRVLYRCNTVRAIRRAFERRGFAHAIWTVEAEPSYFGFSPLAYRIAATAHRCIPPPLRNGIVAFARKPD
jgi:SAM-dependent methyltransferase